jgi:chromosomal replication initiator protein
MAMAELRGKSPMALIRDGLIDTARTGGGFGGSVTPKKIVEKVAKFYELSVAEMCSKSRVSNIKTARQVAMYLISTELSLSTPKIASEVGVKDHTTVMHGISKIKEDIKLNFALREQINELRSKLYE